VAELTDALNALHVGVRDAGTGVQDSELSFVLVNLDITPGKPCPLCHQGGGGMG